MEIQEILVAGDVARWRELAEMIISRHDVQILQEPQSGLVMVRAVDSVELAPFYLGEALLQEAVATVDGVSGYGLVLDDEPARALCLAVIDAALAARVPEEPAIRQAIKAEGERLAEAERQRNSLVAGTAVHFDTMEG